MSAIAQRAKSISDAFEKAMKCDSWGDRLEAADEYRKVLRIYNESSTNFCTSTNDETRIGEIIDHIVSRRDIMEGKPPQIEVSREILQDDFEELKSIMTKFQTNMLTRNSSIIEVTSNHPVQPKPSRRIAGYKYVTLTIDRVGLKDASSYIDPYFCVKVKDRDGRDLCDEQNTPSTTNVQGNYLMFGMNVHLQKAVEELPNDFAIFFELMHYKHKKDKVSCRCFAIIERDEIKPGCGTFELYKKPVDYTRKRLYLFTAKPLFLHLEFSEEVHDRKIDKLKL